MGHHEELTAALYLQISIISQALIFVTRSRTWSFVERPGILLASAFIAAQLVATVIVVYARWGFARIQGVGWGWEGVIWIFSVVTYFSFAVLKFIIRYALSGQAWDSMIQNKVVSLLARVVEHFVTDQKTNDLTEVKAEGTSTKRCSEMQDVPKTRDKEPARTSAPISPLKKIKVMDT